MELPFFSGWERRSDKHRGAATGIPGYASHSLFSLGSWEKVRSESEAWGSRRIRDSRPLVLVWEAQAPCSRESRADSRHGRTVTFLTLPGITSLPASLPQKLFHTFYKCVKVNKLPLWVKKLCQCKKLQAGFFLRWGKVQKDCAGLLSCMCMRILWPAPTFHRTYPGFP